MTNLMRWLFFITLFLSIWLSLLTKKIKLPFLDENSNIVLYIPVIVLFLFGVYAGSIVLWGVYTFNDCKEAALELKQQIEDAKADLKKRGFQMEKCKS